MPYATARTTLSTGAAVMAALAILPLTQPATLAAAFLMDHGQAVAPKMPTTSNAIPCMIDADHDPGMFTMAATVIAGAPDASPPLDFDRPTTVQEAAVGELRDWAVLSDNWDGEGAAAPNTASIREAERFLRLLAADQRMPEPMLLASGRAGLYWNDGDLYADLEFTGDRQVTYFIERRGDGKHKGVVAFNGNTVPLVFAALLSH